MCEVMIRILWDFWIFLSQILSADFICPLQPFIFYFFLMIEFKLLYSYWSGIFIAALYYDKDTIFY